jgi:creatinine amidohydrolase
MRQWQDLTTQDFAALNPDRTVVILPVAAIEQHGPHLPVSVDATICAGLLAETAVLLENDDRFLVLPLQSIGKSNEHQAFPGTLTLSAETLTRQWTEIGDSVARAGLRRLVLFNSHGGQPQIMDIVARDLRVRHGMLAVLANWFKLGQPPGLFSPEEDEFGIHGGSVETSLMLHFRPDLVRLDQARDFRSAARHWAKRNEVLRAHGATSLGWMTQDLNQSGACGNALDADAARGKAVAGFVAQRFATLVKEVAGFPLDRLRPAGDFIAPR